MISEGSLKSPPIMQLHAIAIALRLTRCEHYLGRRNPLALRTTPEPAALPAVMDAMDRTGFGLRHKNRENQAYLQEIFLASEQNMSRFCAERAPILLRLAFRSSNIYQ